MTNAAGILALELDIARLYTCCATCALSIPAVEDLALVKRDGVEQALLSDVGNKPVELGALDQRQHFGERMKFFRGHICCCPVSLARAVTRHPFAVARHCSHRSNWMAVEIQTERDCNGRWILPLARLQQTG